MGDKGSAKLRVTCVRDFESGHPLPLSHVLPVQFYYPHLTGTETRENFILSLASGLHIRPHFPKGAKTVPSFHVKEVAHVEIFVLNQHQHSDQ